jgi:hypothetical protein
MFRDRLKGKGARVSAGSSARSRSSSRRRATSASSKTRVSLSGKSQKSREKYSTSPAPRSHRTSGDSRLNVMTVPRENAASVTHKISTSGDDVTRSSTSQDGIFVSPKRSYTVGAIQYASPPSRIGRNSAERRSSVTFDLEKNSVRIYKPSPRKYHRDEDESRVIEFGVVTFLVSMLTFSLLYNIRSSRILYLLRAFASMSEIERLIPLVRSVHWFTQNLIKVF